MAARFQRRLRPGRVRRRRSMTQSKAFARLLREPRRRPSGQPKLVANWLMGEISPAHERGGAELDRASPAGASSPRLVGRDRRRHRSPNNAARQVFDARSGKGEGERRRRDHRGAGACARCATSASSSGWSTAVIAANPKSVEEFRAGKDKAFNALVGQAMKATQGKADPAQLNALLRARSSATLSFAASGATAPEPIAAPTPAATAAVARPAIVPRLPAPGPELLQPRQLGVVQGVDAHDLGLLVLHQRSAARRATASLASMGEAYELGRQRLADVELGLVARRARGPGAAGRSARSELRTELARVVVRAPSRALPCAGLVGSASAGRGRAGPRCPRRCARLALPPGSGRARPSRLRSAALRRSCFSEPSVLSSRCGLPAFMHSRRSACRR